jgi:hypothetical protein
MSRKTYAIGECDNDLCVLFAIYLEDLGIPKEVIQERLTPSCMEEVGNALELSILGIPPKDDESEGEKEERALLEAFRANNPLDQIRRRDEIEANQRETEERLIQCNVNFGNIDLEQFADMSESDSFRTRSEKSDRDSVESWERNLPHLNNLHASNNEIEGLVYGFKRENTFEDEYARSEKSLESDNAPDNVLNEIEELGIDLVDPNRDTIYQPDLRKIGMIWDPGGGVRPIPKRFNRLRGKTSRRA